MLNLSTSTLFRWGIWKFWRRRTWPWPKRSNSWKLWGENDVLYSYQLWSIMNKRRYSSITSRFWWNKWFWRDNINNKKLVDLGQMSVHQTRSLPRDIRYILHPLNVSKSKSTFSFQKTQRFQDPKSHSPNKFYNIASEKSKMGFSVPKGHRPLIENLESIPPNRYNIKS